MLDIGMFELFVIGALALIVVGPKELPGLLRSVGQFVAKARGMARDFQRSMEDAAREADLDGVVNTVKSGNKLPFDNQIVDTMKEFEKSVKTEITSTDAEVRRDDAPSSAPAETAAKAPEAVETAADPKVEAAAATPAAAPASADAKPAATEKSA